MQLHITEFLTIEFEFIHVHHSQKDEQLPVQI